MISGHLDGSVNLWDFGTWAERARFVGYGEVQDVR